MAGCPAIELCRGRKEDLRFGTIDPDDAANKALLEAFQGIQLTGYDHSNDANQDGSPFFADETTLDCNVLLPEAVQIVCFGDPIAPGNLYLTPESKGLLEAAVTGTGCWESCNRYQAFRDYQRFVENHSR